MASTRYLTLQQERDLVEWVAGRGENFGQYVLFCDTYNVINRFSEAYFKRWCQKKRPKLQSKRAEHKDALRQASLLTRSARLAELEKTFAKLDTSIDQLDMDERGAFDILVRLEEQKRKTLEAIAKERGEWMQKEQAPDETALAVADATEKAMKALERGLRVVS